MKKIIVLFLLIVSIHIFTHTMNRYELNNGEDENKQEMCCLYTCLGCLSYCSGIATFHSINYVAQDDVTFSLALSIIAGIGTWKIGKQCYLLGIDCIQKHHYKEKDI